MLTVKQLTFSPFQENTYVIYNDQGWCAIVDPGCYFPQERKELTEFIKEAGLEAKYLLNTHCHLDHVFGAQFVNDHYGLGMHLHPKEEPVLEHSPTSGVKWGVPFEAYKGALFFIEEGDKIAIGEDLLEVLFTPGHSPGSISFYCSKQSFVIGGDVLFRLGIGRTDLPGGNFETLEKSITEKLYQLPDETIVYSGHGPSTTIGYEKQHNPYVGYAKR